MKIERILVHFPSVTTASNGVVEHHQRVTRSGDYPRQGKKHGKTPDKNDPDVPAHDQPKELTIEVVALDDGRKDEQGSQSSEPPHLLDIEA